MMGFFRAPQIVSAFGGAFVCSCSLCDGCGLGVLSAKVVQRTTHPKMPKHADKAYSPNLSR